MAAKTYADTCAPHGKVSSASPAPGEHRVGARSELARAHALAIGADGDVLALHPEALECAVAEVRSVGQGQ